MRAYAAEVVDALEWTGPAMVEFMRTPDDEFVLIEVNGRYWGSVPFAIECGVDVPWLHYRVLRGDRPTEAWSYPVGASEHRLLSGDLNWLAEQLRAGNLDAIPTFVDSCLSTSQTFVTPDDPAPMVGAIGQAAVVGTTTVARHCLGALGAGNDTSEE
jgi:predicted ATP-grasp superfamily ATP-dependent carboligase